MCYPPLGDLSLYFRISLGLEKRQLRALLNDLSFYCPSFTLPDQYFTLSTCIVVTELCVIWVSESNKRSSLSHSLCSTPSLTLSLFFPSPIFFLQMPFSPPYHLSSPLTFVSLTVNPFQSLSMYLSPSLLSFLFFPLLSLPPPLLLPSVSHCLPPLFLFNFSYSWKTQVVKIAPISNM